MIRSSLLGAAFVLLSAAPAAAAPDLTLNATHSRALRATPPNTTPYSGTLTLTVTNAGTDPTDGTRDRRESVAAGLTALTNNPALGAGPTAATGQGWTCTRRRPARAATRSRRGPSYPPVG